MNFNKFVVKCNLRFDFLTCHDLVLVGQRRTILVVCYTVRLLR